MTSTARRSTRLGPCSVHWTTRDDLLIDHDDSFVHTLASYVADLGHAPRVVRARALTLESVRALDPAAIILSPGPGAPIDCPLALEVIAGLGPRVPILGVCLGHQCIAAAHGAHVTRARTPRHGMTSPIMHDGKGVFAGLPAGFLATRYHSLAVPTEKMPADLLVTATASDDGVVMGIRHRTHPVEGVQFHPESILTEHGHALVANFLTQAAR